MEEKSYKAEKIFARFDGEGSHLEQKKALPVLCLELLAKQRRVWPALEEGCRSLQHVRWRDLPCKGFSVRLQHNPGRIKSSLADMAKPNSSDCHCFLCLDHLPPDQKGILYRGEYLILCNPMPIFSSHFTLPGLNHCQQSIADHVENFFNLMADFGSAWTVLYNGPKCGASAPDHLHFQVIPSGQMPVEKEVRQRERLAPAREAEGAVLYRVKGLGRELILLKGNDSTAAAEAFRGFLKAMRDVLSTDEEPMINVAGSHRGREWHLVIFPRRKHRPDAFFREGDDRLVISPGVIDMGGVLITPVIRDFERLDAATVESIYREVSLETETAEKAIDALCTMHPAPSPFLPP